MKSRPGVTVVITPDAPAIDPREPSGYTARFAGARSHRVGRGLTEWEAVRDLFGAGEGRPGKGLHPPGMRKAAEGGGSE